MQSGSHGAAQGECKTFHQLSSLGSEQLVLGLVLPALSGINPSAPGLGRLEGSLAKVHLGLEGRGAPQGSSYLSTF